MSETGRIWPTRRPRGVFTGIALAFVGGWLAFRVWESKAPVEAFYLGQYVKTTAVGKVRFRAERAENFSVLLPTGEAATVALMPSGFNRWIAQNVFHDRPLTEVLRWPLGCFGALLALGMVGGGIADAKRNRAAENGRLLRGPKLISGWRFNLLTRGDGLRFQYRPAKIIKRAGKELCVQAPKFLQIKRDREANHIQLTSDSGGGKTSIIRDIIYQIEERGDDDAVIVFDPEREYISEFYDEARGDWVLNPLDERCPYWAIEQEAKTEAEAEAIALGLWPDEPNQQPFFKKHPRAIFAYLVWRFNQWNEPEGAATCANLTDWLASPRTEVTPRVAGTRHAVSTDANAKDQSQGLWATLGEAATPLGMMPPTPDGRRTWTARDWAQERKGWIFITSTPDTLEALRPIQSLWLDMLILKLQSAGRQHRRVWLIIDEVAALKQLPQLHSALTRQRKSGNPIVLGFQGMAQIEHLYGDKMAQTIISQAFTNIILKTREPKAARHLSDLIGKQEVERVKESRPSAGSKGGSYSTERTVIPVVMESEIQTLDDLHGFFVQRDRVVRISFVPRQRRIKGTAFIERTITPRERVLLPTEVKPEPEPEVIEVKPKRKRKQPTVGETPGSFSW